MKVRAVKSDLKLLLKAIEELRTIKNIPKVTHRGDRRFRKRLTDKFRAKPLPVVVPQYSLLLRISSRHNELTLLFIKRTLTVFLQTPNMTMAQNQGRQTEMQMIQ